MKHHRQWLFAAAASLSLAAAVPSFAQDTPVYRFSPVNQYGLELTARYWNPIMEYITAKSGVKLQLKIGRTSADTTAYVLANEVEFVFSNHLFSPERDHLGWKVFGRRQTPPIHSQIVVMADSPTRKIEELANQPVAFPGPEALVAYKFSYAQLINRKVPVEVVFGGNMDGAFAQLTSGKVKAVGANSQLTEGWAKREGKKVRVLWQSEPLYDLALMASRNVPEKDLKAVSKAFAEMGQDVQGVKILAASGNLVGLLPTASFVASNGSEYSSYRNFYKTAPPSLR
ncbi:PhnD ABC-type phosphate/phosphonate transport system, periplasmic component [Comamonadaceae bacterium]|jgi:phosphonate transport system substrate-binding protein